MMGVYAKIPLPLMVLRNTNGGGEILASPPHMVLRDTMWGGDAKISPPPLVLRNTIILLKFVNVFMILHPEMSLYL